MAYFKSIVHAIIRDRDGGKDSDRLGLGIMLATGILLAGTLVAFVPRIVDAVMGTGPAEDMPLISVLCLNLALLLFTWKRYADLSRQIMQHRLAEDEACRLAQRDPLTQCLNRRSGIPAMQDLAQTAQASGRELALFMIDVDNFKQINDLYGHAAGDTVLAQVASRLIAAMPADGIVIRLGGDEFSCCLSSPPDSADRVDYLAASLLRTVARPIMVEGGEVETSVSVGVATQSITGTGLDAKACEDLLHRADVALYQAKHSGRNRYAFYDAEVADKQRRLTTMGNAIRLGILRGEFVPYYEQQIDLSTGALAGFEMLARWQSPDLGLVTPDRFIAVAEQMDLIAPLSESLIRKALLDAREWSPHLSLSVNISPLQLRDPWFAQKIIKLLTDTGFPPARLELEITESCLHEDVAAVRSIVYSLKQQGIRISLDDFGTGYSSLAQLRALPFDRIKIDRAFVREMAEDGKPELLHGIIALGRGLNLPITAEGIETPEVLDMLRSLGELNGQGYLYGRPEDAATTRERLARQSLLAAQIPADAMSPMPPMPTTEPVRIAS